MLRLGPIAEHHRDRRQNLNIDAIAVAFLNPRFRTPAIRSDLAEKVAVIAHHLRAAVFVVIERYETAVTKTLLPVGNVLGKDVSVYVDL